MTDPAAFESARAAFLRGLEHFQAGRFEAAEREYVGSLKALPGRVSTLLNLAAVRLRLGQGEGALAAADAVLAQEPGNAEAMFHRANALAKCSRVAEADAAFDALTEAMPGLAEGHAAHGQHLRDTGRLERAAAAFERAIACGAEPEMHRYFLAAVRGEALAAPPRAYVQALFDDYAPVFDEHLVGRLGYRAHEAVVALALEGRGPVEIDGEGIAAAGRRHGTAIDLGCGTGLCGAALRPVVERLVGVDLSPGMLERAAATGHYDELVHADVTAHLLATAPGSAAILVAADVFIYVGALHALLDAAARALAPGGVFAFTTEGLPEGATAGAGAEHLMPSLRYAHGETALATLATRCGFVVEAMRRGVIRHEQQQPVAGTFWRLRRA
jgi:predicted TPR repeat methyltransferase